MENKAYVFESANDFVVEMDAPGMDLNEISVSVDRHILSLRGLHESERRIRRFSRSWVLPPEVDEDAIDATLKNGVLRVAIPKNKRDSPKRIEIRT